MSQKRIVIAGAGLVGSLTAVLLGRKGYKVTVLERRPDMRAVTIPAGRSINLAMSDRGWRALEKAGLAEEVRPIAIPMYKRTMHDEQQNLTYQPYGKDGEAIYSVSRGLLNKLLLSAAERDKEDVEIFFNKRITDIDLDSQVLHIRDEESGAQQEIGYDILLGADGAYSAVRNRLMYNDRFSYSQTYIEHGYKELHMPPGADGKHLMEVETLHIWPRGEYMMIALPNPDGTFTCTLFFPWEGKESFASVQTDEEIDELFRRRFPDLIGLIPDYREQFRHNPTSSLMYVKCHPWNYKGNVLLLGDAAHAIVPFYGQGMNAGFEDARIFTEMLEANDWDFEKVIPAFAEIQYKNGHAVADLAMRNFVEMRDLTADPEFLLRKKIERKVHEKSPSEWVPLYSMVTFRETGYAEAWAEGLRQDRIMEQVMQLPGIHENWDSDAVTELVLSLNKTVK